MYVDNSFAVIQLFENGFETRIPQPFVSIACHETNSVALQGLECIFDFPESPFHIRQGQGRKKSKAHFIVPHQLRCIFIPISRLLSSVRPNC